MTNTFKYTNINQIPSLTWNWLKMNRATLEIARDENVCEFNVRNLTDDVLFTKDGTQIKKSLPEMKSGIGSDAQKILSDFNVVPSAFVLKAGKKIAPIVFEFDATAQKSSLSEQIFVAEENSNLNVIFVYSSQKNAGGFFGTQTKIWVKQNAKVHVAKVNLLGDNFTRFDETLFFCEDGAKAEISQIELGGKRNFVAQSTILQGFNSSFKSDSAYHTKNDQLLDMNYVVLHKGEKTDTQIIAKGVMADESTKIYRGTIDFERGCEGATGNEQEETLLLSPAVVNKSLPVLLCNEEDVSGTHGATIGKIGEDELFYMQSRGIGKSQAEKILSQAKILEVSHKIDDEKTQKSILDFLGILDE